jgi:membrane fusion protein (multidrug efflux system)
MIPVAPRPAFRAAPAGPVALLLILAALAPAGCSGRRAAQAPAADAAVEIGTSVAAVQPVTRLLRVTGSLAADEEAEVAAETAGRVVATLVERGSQVREGAPLLQLSPTEAEASLHEAEANVGQIEVRLGLTADQPFDVEKVPEVSNARAAKELAEADYARVKKLYDEKVVSGSEFDQRRTQVEVTQRLYDTARNNARQLYRSLDAARARLTLARKALDDTVVKAPFTGLVVERKVSVGDFVTRGTKVATVVRISPLRVEVTVPEQSIAAVRAGQPLALEVDAYPGEKFAGRVRFISPALRSDQRALTVEAVVPNPDGRLKPGLFATAAIEEEGKAKALFVPTAAVRNLDGSTRVYVVSGDHVEERLVTVGQVVGDATEIANGLTEGQEVASTNLDKLTDGTRVRTRHPAVAPASRPAQTTPSR